MELNTVSLTKFTANAEYIFTNALDSVTRAAYNSGLFKTIDIGSNSGDTRIFTEMDHDLYANYKGEGDQAERASVLEGYNKTITAGRIGTDIGITVEMRKYNKYPEVMNRLTNLGEYCPNRMDLDLTHRFTFGTATTYADMDGRTVYIDCGNDLQLFYSAHTLTSGLGTYRTRLANNPVLSKGALEAAELLMVQRYNNLYQLKSVTPDILWTSNDPSTCNTAREYLQSTADPDATQSGVINPYKGKYRHVILPLLATDKNGAYDSTKAKYWGLASSKDSTSYIGIWEQPFMIAPSVGDGIEMSTENWNYGTRASYGIGTVAAHHLCMSSGDGTA